MLFVDMSDIEYNTEFANKVTQACFDVYNSIGKKGKPQAGREWTKMSCIVKTDSTGAIEVLTLATGTKCIGENNRTKRGNLLNDSHAEVLARRLLMKCFYKEVQNCHIGAKESGDASIFPRDKTISYHRETTINGKSSKRQCTEVVDKPESKKLCRTVLQTNVQSRVEIVNQSEPELGNTSQSTHSEGPRGLNQPNEVVKNNQIKLTRINKNISSKIIDKSSTNIYAGSNISGFDASSNSVDTTSTNIDASSNKDYTTSTNIDASSYSADTCWNNIDESSINIDKISSDIGTTVTNLDTHSDNIDTSSKNVGMSCITKDIHRTGAKCVPNGKQDSLEDGESYHVTGALRVKPGRGDRTLSMCCSDKMMKWCILGINGGLLSNFLNAQIYLTSVVISNGEFNKDALLRAMSTRGRIVNNNFLLVHKPHVLRSSLRFCDSKEMIEQKCRNVEGRMTPAGTAILWCPSCDIHEVTASGRKHGITKKDLNTPKAKTSICKENLFHDFKKTLKLLQKDAGFTSSSTYREHKRACQRYRKMRENFFSVFDDWIRKPQEHEEFF
ncbi:tRNA-specific adenosine deaminase 1-like isoform X2 [Hydractinia symbiolongicarpus]|uniref:tRNA-specific adenosine deaminase 1-like isoform X2 n=1 Tax=Hydractinia symbiolongicarpus TaxID=13093 RepID=UPI00254B9220|nr:tRNA-specific adenosine deaminase 1-like isoform X2 [Hydractinia symbiolongicarpus]